MASTEKGKVIYIMGHARSGSTILNIMLGSIDNVVAAGETDNFYRSGLINNEFCSCGDHLQNCEFWAPIVQSISAEIDEPVEDFIQYTRQVENWRNLLFSKRMSRKGLTTEKYLRVNQQLYKQIFKRSESATLVDASKSPMRFFHLRNMDNVEFTLLHIVRDPRAVCWSQLRSFKKDLSQGLERDMSGVSFFSTIKSLYINAYVSERMKRLNSNSVVTVNYDNLAQASRESLQDIEFVSGLSTSALIDKIANDEALTQSHNAAGNRLRLSKHIVVRHDETWRTGLSRFQYYLITVLTSPLLLRYGFKL